MKSPGSSGVFYYAAHPKLRVAAAVTVLTAFASGFGSALRVILEIPAACTAALRRDLALLFGIHACESATAASALVVIAVLIGQHRGVVKNEETSCPWRPVRQEHQRPAQCRIW
jgi:hypothetical protein